LFSQRLKSFISSKNLSIRAFEKKCQIKQGTISRMIKNNTSITSDTLALILDSWKELDANWLLLGEGQMTKSAHTPHLLNTHGKSSAPSKELIEKILDNANEQIKWQQNQIDSLTSFITKTSQSYDKKIVEQEQSAGFRKASKSATKSSVINQEPEIDNVLLDFSIGLDLDDFLKKNYSSFDINLNKHYSNQEAIKIIGAAISKGSKLQKNTFFIRDCYHAICKMIDLGFRTTAVELAQDLIPRAAWHQQFGIAQDLCGQLLFHFYHFGNRELAEKYDIMYKKYTTTINCEYEVKKLYCVALYNHEHNLPIDAPQLIQMLDSIKEKLEHPSLWYKYYYYQCKYLMYEGEELKNLLEEAIYFFENAYFRHTSFISIFTKNLIEYLIGKDELISAKSLIEAKLPKTEIGSIPWFRYTMTYTIVLMENDELPAAEIQLNNAMQHNKYPELPEDRRIEWEAIQTKLLALKNQKQKDDT